MNIPRKSIRVVYEMRMKAGMGGKVNLKKNNHMKHFWGPCHLMLRSINCRKVSTQSQTYTAPISANVYFAELNI